MDSKITRLIEQASVIVGALPYLQAYRDKTFLIKFGGSAMDDTRLVKKLMRDIVLLEVLGFNPVIVHGGGKAISKAMAEAGLEARFVNGLRVTTPEAISIVERTLSGTINPGLVQMFRDYGGKGVGIPGTEIFVGERIHEKDEQGNPIDIGEVGNVIGCLTERITEALELQITPIVSPLAKELGTHKPLNVNADLAAAALAKELKPVKLIYISDVPGIMKDPSDPSTLIKSVTRTEALDLIKDGTVSGGMIPKIHSAIDALNAGVRKGHFIDGRLPHTLLLEIFTPDGIGTEIIREQRGLPRREIFPLSPGPVPAGGILLHAAHSRPPLRLLDPARPRAARACAGNAAPAGRQGRFHQHAHASLPRLAAGRQPPDPDGEKHGKRQLLPLHRYLHH